MWVFLNDAFLSIVSHPRRHDLLTVRARRESDIRNVFPRARILPTPLRDYQFRAIIKRKEVGDAMAGEVDRIDYPNFKNSVLEPDRASACSAVWTTMMRWGEGLLTGMEIIH